MDQNEAAVSQAGAHAGKKQKQGFIQGLSELALWVQDLEGAISFYRDHLGFTLFDYTREVNAFLRSGDLVLALFAPVIEGNTAMAQQYLQRYGGPHGAVYHVGLKVAAEDLDLRAQDLKDGGLTIQGPMNFATGRRSYFLEDPDGNFIELTDR